MSALICAFFALLFGFICSTVGMMYGILEEYRAAIFALALCFLSGLMVVIAMRFETSIDDHCAATRRGCWQLCVKSNDVVRVTVLRREPEPHEYSIVQV